MVSFFIKESVKCKFYFKIQDLPYFNLFTGFVIYLMLVVIISTSIVVHFGPRYGHRHVCVYVALCSVIGSITVMACKGLGVGIKETISGQ